MTIFIKAFLFPSFLFQGSRISEDRFAKTDTEPRAPISIFAINILTLPTRGDLLESH